jgi:hypothetical protein
LPVLHFAMVVDTGHNLSLSCALSSSHCERDVLLPRCTFWQRKKGCEMLLLSDPGQDSDELEDIDLTLRRALAPLMGLKPEEITPADVQKFRDGHIYPNMRLDLRNEHGGFIRQNERCLTEREISILREETDEFFASLEH